MPIKGGVQESTKAQARQKAAPDAGHLGCFVVTSGKGDGAVKRRIMDMGITKGCSIFVRKVAPLGDPVEVTVRGYELSLRKEDAQMVEVE